MKSTPASRRSARRREYPTAEQCCARALRGGASFARVASDGGGIEYDFPPERETEKKRFWGWLENALDLPVGSCAKSWVPDN